MKRIQTLFWLFIVISLPLGAAEGDGGYAGAFLRMGIGARAKAMGNAFSAIPEDAFAGIYNPALLPHLDGRQAAVSFAFLPLDRKLNFIGYAMPLQPKRDGDSEGGSPMRAGFAVAWIQAGVDDIDGRDFSGNAIGAFSYSENAFFLSFALSPIEKVGIGINGKILYCRFPELNNDNSALTSSGFGIDFGIFYQPFSDLMLGLVSRDHISKNNWNTENLWERGTSVNDHYPKRWHLAAAYRTPLKWMLLSGEVEDNAEMNPRYHFGMEATYEEVGALRAGLDHDHLTFGLGFAVKLLGKQVSMNYAYVAPTVAPSADHIFSWHFIF
ncbi:hypothetical protein JXO59_05940 [candidate division KSB1 bacterium]|nr:hypothetical protein [candidate division KSB1 bacterium]